MKVDINLGSNGCLNDHCGLYNGNGVCGGDLIIQRNCFNRIMVDREYQTVSCFSTCPNRHNGICIIRQYYCTDRTPHYNIKANDIKYR